MSNKKSHKINLAMYFSEQIAQIPFISSDGIELHLEDAYICPLCLQITPLSKINDFTIEHVPPLSVGGAPILVTCKKCNSNAGFNIDAFLQNELQLDYDIKYFCKKPTRSTIILNGFDINGKTIIEEDNIFHFSMNPQNNNPEKYSSFMNELKTHDGGYQLLVDTKIGRLKRDLRLANISLLKSAYLKAFSCLGYPYILNSNLNIVREQIINHSKDILKNIYFVGNNNDIPDEQSCGVYCANVNEIKCIIVIMSIGLSKSELSYKVAIALPHPEDSNGSLYSSLLERIKSQKHIQMFSEICTLPIKPVLIDETLCNFIGNKGFLRTT